MGVMGLLRDVWVWIGLRLEVGLKWFSAVKIATSVMVNFPTEHIIPCRGFLRSKVGISSRTSNFAIFNLIYLGFGLG
mgnify:CR=1 FL=1